MCTQPFVRAFFSRCIMYIVTHVHVQQTKGRRGVWRTRSPRMRVLEFSSLDAVAPRHVIRTAAAGWLVGSSGAASAHGHEAENPWRLLASPRPYVSRTPGLIYFDHLSTHLCAVSRVCVCVCTRCVYCVFTVRSAYAVYYYCHTCATQKTLLYASRDEEEIRSVHAYTHIIMHAEETNRKKRFIWISHFVYGKSDRDDCFLPYLYVYFLVLYTNLTVRYCCIRSEYFDVYYYMFSARIWKNNSRGMQWSRKIRKVPISLYCITGTIKLVVVLLNILKKRRGASSPCAPLRFEH